MKPNYAACRAQIGVTAESEKVLGFTATWFCEHVQRMLIDSKPRMFKAKGLLTRSQSARAASLLVLLAISACSSLNQSSGTGPERGLLSTVSETITNSGGKVSDFIETPL